LYKNKLVQVSNTRSFVAIIRGQGHIEIWGKEKRALVVTLDHHKREKVAPKFGQEASGESDLSKMV